MAKLTLTGLTRMTETQLSTVRVTDALHTAYPRLVVREDTPHCFGHDGNLQLTGETLTVPEGSYSSRKHFHRASTHAVEVESAKRKLNARPLFLLKSRAYNGDYSSMKESFFLFGANEDDSYFLHKIRPNAGESIETARQWMWELTADEAILERQGDLAFISKKRPAGTRQETVSITIGNHTVHAEEIRITKHKLFVKAASAIHAEHGETPVVPGWSEVRLARQWEHGYGD